MKTPRRWLAGAGIAAVAIGAALFAGGLGFAHWGDDHAYPGPYGTCPMWGSGPARGALMGGTDAEIDGVLSPERARALGQSYLARYGNDLEIDEVMEFRKGFYLRTGERDTGRYALELLVLRRGRVIPEPGPNMMWNLRYGGMGISCYRSTGEEMPVSPEEALTIAQEYLDQTMSGATVAPKAAAFYGYYTIHVLRDGRIVGMLSVNGYSGRVWYHSWHGEFVGPEEGDHEG